MSSQELNQCDGCRRGLALRPGPYCEFHVDDKGLAVMVCERHLYIEKEHLGDPAAKTGIYSSRD